MELLIYILSSISITHIIVGSSLFGPIRSIIIKSENRFCKFLKELVTCHQCTGFWVGFFMYFVWHLLFHYNAPINIGSIVIAFLITGPIISLLSDITYRIKKYLCEECG